MALTARENQSLIDIGLVDFFEQHRKLYASMAKEAYEYTKGPVEAAGLPVRIDDVIQALEPALAIEPTLRVFLAEKKKREKYWPKRFGDYVLDQLWKELTGGDTKAEERGG